MLIQVGAAEILCDMGRRLAANAKDAGVDVTLEVEPHMFHAWPLFAGALPEADEAIAREASLTLRVAASTDCAGRPIRPCSRRRSSAGCCPTAPSQVRSASASRGK